MKKKIIVDIPFNIDLSIYYPDRESTRKMYEQAFVVAQTEEWIRYRIGVFMKYTAKSLINQTCQDFVCLMRYTKPTEAIIMNELSKYDKLPENIIFTADGDAMIRTLLKRVKYLYHLRIDADNMYDFDFIRKIDTFPYYKGLECILCQKGYLYDENTQRLATIDHYSPSIYAYIYKKEDYFTVYGNKIFELHFNAVKMEHQVLEGYNYLLVVHKNNLDNKFNAIVRYFKGEEVIDTNSKQEILNKYKI